MAKVTQVWWSKDRQVAIFRLANISKCVGFHFEEYPNLGYVRTLVNRINAGEQYIEYDYKIVISQASDWERIHLK